LTAIVDESIAKVTLAAFGFVVVLAEVAEGVSVNAF